METRTSRKKFPDTIKRVSQKSDIGHMISEAETRQKQYTWELRYDFLIKK